MNENEMSAQVSYECGQRYAAEQLLSNHMDRHMNVKSFHCHFIGCDKSFFSKTYFENHMKKIQINS